MKRTIVSFIFAAAIFCGYNFTAMSVEVEFNTITEALNYTGDKNAVTKLIITGNIEGDDYSDESE
jgi:uncharacterized membrane protein